MNRFGQFVPGVRSEVPEMASGLMQRGLTSHFPFP